MIVGTAQAAADLLAPLLAKEEVECVIVLLLDGARVLVAIERFPGRGVSDMELPVRGILKAALQREASGLVVAHNHPSGDPTPSRADVDATRRLASAAAELDVRLHDHLVFAAGSFRSFRELGLL